jgi:hypothetical protein
MSKKAIKVAIAGTKGFNDFKMLCDAIDKSGFTVKELASGGESGISDNVSEWAENNDIPFKFFHIDWEGFDQPDAVVKKNKWGKDYNSNAAFFRDSEIAEYSDALIVVDGGNTHIKREMKRLEKSVYEYDPEDHIEGEDIVHHF